ncbi:hypothetical protein ACFV4M_18825 [Kitasatospora indigofera]
MSRLRWAGIVDRAAVIVTGYDAVGGCTLRQAFSLRVETVSANG